MIKLKKIKIFFFKFLLIKHSEDDKIILIFSEEQNKLISKLQNWLKPKLIYERMKLNLDKYNVDARIFFYFPIQNILAFKIWIKKRKNNKEKLSRKYRIKSKIDSSNPNFFQSNLDFIRNNFAYNKTKEKIFFKWEHRMDKHDHEFINERVVFDKRFNVLFL